MIRLVLTIAIAAVAAVAIHSLYGHVGKTIAAALYVPLQDAQLRR